VTLLALALVLTAALLHATWNLLAKRVAGQLPFIFVVCLFSSVFWAPFALGVVLIQQPELGWQHLVGIGGSAILHLAYFSLLQRGYRVGDFSIVYPLARSTGPALSSAGAILFFGERPSMLAGAGMVLIVVGMFVLTMRSGEQAEKGVGATWALRYGVLTGFFIALYTLWDARSVRFLGMSPILLDWGSNVGRVLLLLPFAGKWRDEAFLHWREHRLEIAAVAILGTFAYILVLAAMKFTPVSYVAPVRETSILFGTFMGMRYLSEGGGARRIIAAAMMVAGVVALAFG
jgi:drug/metabolite transporter (DMT)-like permease